ncbi:MAG: DUF1573 domain-containing protein [Verrucomicrobiota bacterium]|nr:DUF1573 domain-containing protein [Verrucomicrobiota bacterium]
MSAKFLVFSSQYPVAERIQKIFLLSVSAFTSICVHLRSSVVKVSALFCLFSFFCGYLSAKPAAVDYDFGTVNIGTPLKHLFQWKNPSKKQVKVGDVAFSCTCMKLLSKNEFIAPGGTLDVEVGWVAEKVGVLKFEVLVVIEGLDKPLSFKIKGAGEDPHSKPIPTAYLESGALQQMITDKAPLLMIDLRSPDKFVQFNLPGSIPMTVAQVKTRDDMKKQTLILIPEIETPTFWQEYQALIGEGFQSVRVLKGGLQAWKHSGYPLGGMNAAAKVLVMDIDPSSAYEVLRNGHYVLVNAGNQKISFKSTVIKPVPVNELLNQNKPAYDGIILAGESSPATSGKISQKLPGINLYSVTGGINDLNEIVAIRETVTKPGVMTVGSSGMTLVSGSSSSPGSGGGCGGCPK